MEDGEHEPEVDGDRRLSREERLDALLDREVRRSTSSSKAITSSASSGSLSRRALIEPRSALSDELALLEQRRLEGVELLLERDPRRAHPNRPVT